MTWYSLRVEPASNRDEAVAALFGAGAGGVHEDGTALVTSFPDEDSAQAAAAAMRATDPLAKCLVSPAPDVDWATAWRAHARAVSSGRFTIVPPWLAGGLDPALTVVIDPGMAFGTGDHASTRGAALLLQDAVVPGMSVADLGSGSAVLSILAARLGATRVWAIENDPEARENAAENVARNGVGSVVHLIEGDAGLLLPLVAPVDVIVANIVSSVINRLLPVMAGALRPGGVAVIAGILESESSETRASLDTGGWEVNRMIIEEDWWSGLARRR